MIELISNCMKRQNLKPKFYRKKGIKKFTSKYKRKKKMPTLLEVGKRKGKEQKKLRR